MEFWKRKTPNWPAKKVTTFFQSIVLYYAPSILHVKWPQFSTVSRDWELTDFAQWMWWWWRGWLLLPSMSTRRAFGSLGSMSCCKIGTSFQVSERTCALGYTTSYQNLSRLGSVFLQSYLEICVDSRDFIHSNRTMIVRNRYLYTFSSVNRKTNWLSWG